VSKKLCQDITIKTTNKKKWIAGQNTKLSSYRCAMCLCANI